MAQGEAISVLLRAEELEPGEGYAEAAQKAAQPFRCTIASGGIVWRSNGDVFLEEVAVEPAAHILNGCIYSLWGLHDLNKALNVPWAGELFEEVLRTLEQRLPMYDLGWWSAYSLLRTRRGRPHLATLKYHAFHISQLCVLEKMTQRQVFGEYSRRFKRYVDERSSRVRVLSYTARQLAGRALFQEDTIAGGSHCVLSS